MTTLAYVTFTTSTSATKRFKVPMGAFKPVTRKNQSRKRTANGRSDNTEGAVKEAWQASFKVRGCATGADPDGVNYGVLADLQAYYSYNNPNGSPSNRFTFTNHTGTAYTVEFVGELQKENMTPYMDGANSWHFVTITFEEV